MLVIMMIRYSIDYEVIDYLVIINILNYELIF